MNSNSNQQNTTKKFRSQAGLNQSNIKSNCIPTLIKEKPTQNSAITPNLMKQEIMAKVDRYFKARTPEGNGVIRDVILRPAFNKDSINVGDNDYLCIAKVIGVSNHDSEVVMSNVFISDEGPQGKLEKDMAEYIGKESSIITQSGYAANSGLLQCLCTNETNVYIDSFLHASFRDGIGFRKPKMHIFKHNNVNDLERLVEDNGYGIIVVESIYSVTGDSTPLKKVIDIKKKYGCLLVLDESHSLGLYGEKGRGYSSLFDHQYVDIITASLAKAFCARAGIIAGDKRLVEYVKENSMPHTFSSCIMNYDLVRMHKILHKVKSMDKEREHLMDISKEFRKSLGHTGVPYTKSEFTSPIISLVFTSERKLVKMNQYLLKKNIFASCFVHPTTARNAPCLRFTLSSNITMKDVNYIISQISSYNGSKL